MDLIKELSLIGIVPVIAIENSADACHLADALYRGGLPCAEVTFRTAAAEESIRIMSKNYPEMIVGAGTVLNVNQVDLAINAGAKFIVSPGLNPDVVKYCLQKDILVIPGCATPTEVEASLSLGLDTVKFFPAEAAGGISMIKAMAAPYGKVRFMPTGGITADNLNDYLSFDKVFACGGSWMVNKKFLKSRDFDAIESMTKQAVNTMLNLKFDTICINASETSESSVDIKQLKNIFEVSAQSEGNTVQYGDSIKIIEGSSGDGCNYITVSSNYIERAKYHLERRGVQFDSESEEFGSSGELISINTGISIAGFKIKLVKR